MELGPGKVISEHAWNNELGFCAWTQPLGRSSLSQAKAEGVIPGLAAGTVWDFSHAGPRKAPSGRCPPQTSIHLDLGYSLSLISLVLSTTP